MLVQSRMSAPAVTITPDTVFREALKVMHYRRFRRLPVVDESGRLVGIVSERDLPHVSSSYAPAISVWDLNHLLSSVEIKQVMTTDVITTTPETPIEDAARLMAENKVGGLPVVNEHGHVVGVITETDIFKAFVEMFAGGHPGLRLTLVVPGGNGVLLKLGEAVSKSGGHVVSVVSFPGESAGERGLVVKVQDANKDQLIDVLQALGSHVVDAREV